MPRYTVVTIANRFFSGTLDPAKLAQILNEHAAQGWRLARNVQDRKRVLLFFSRAVHYFIFERDGEE